MYLENHPNPTLEGMELSVDRLQKYAEVISKIRSWILEKASAVDEGPAFKVGMALKEVSAVEKKKFQRNMKRETGANPTSYKEFIEPVPPGCRKKGSKRGALKVPEKINIAFLAIV